MPAPTTKFFTGWMPFLLRNQQQQSSEGKRGLFSKEKISKGEDK